jgi:hypothetical protein
MPRPFKGQATLEGCCLGDKVASENFYFSLYLVPEFPPISRKGAKGIPYPGSGPLPIDGATRVCRSWNGELRPDRVAELQEDRSLLP